ncbi:MAG: hypothetical protein ACE5L6_00035 [Candidatus Bathyarchaeia archaeon]
MTQKTLVDLVEILLAKKRTWNVDTSFKIVIGGTEIGAIAVTGKIDYVPSETKGKTPK